MEDIRDIKQIVDKIVIEADLNPAEYTVEDRISDVNDIYLYYIEKATQIGSSEPISGGEAVSENFVVVPGSNVFTKTKPDIPLMRVDFAYAGSPTLFRKVTDDTTRLINGYDWCNMKFFTDEKRVWIEGGLNGTLRVTYAHGGITLFTEADYNESTPPEPEFMPREFRKLLWLNPATVQAEYYKKDRAISLRNQLDRFEQLFFNRYKRKSATMGRIVTDEDSNCGGGTNYR
jgi:hypothetical protein